jgi:hypothetical protein
MVQMEGKVFAICFTLLITIWWPLPCCWEPCIISWTVLRMALHRQVGGTCSSWLQHLCLSARQLPIRHFQGQVMGFVDAVHCFIR